MWSRKEKKKEYFKLNLIQVKREKDFGFILSRTYRDACYIEIDESYHSLLKFSVAINIVLLT